MSLDALSLDDLMTLTDTLGALAAAGQVLAKAGFVPVFDLSPGYPMALQIDATMPSLDWVGFYDGEDDPVLVEPAAPVMPEVAAEPAPPATMVELTDAPGDDPAPVPQPAVVKPVPPGHLTHWTADENALALRIYAEQRHLGRAKGLAMMVVADALGRPFAGTCQRFKTGLREEKERIEAEVADAAKPKPVRLAGAPTPKTGVKADPAAKPAPMPQPAAEPQRNVEKAASIWADMPAAPKAPPVAQVAPVAVTVAPPVTPAARPVPAAPPADLAAHLAGLPHLRGWLEDWDADLMTMACNGLDMATIANDLGIDAGTVKARFDALTGLHRDDTGKPVRRFARDVVRDHLCRPAQATAAE